jgi:hypothetical protein
MPCSHSLSSGHDVYNSAPTQMSQNISFDLGSYRNHRRLNFHVSINLRVLGLLGVALTTVDAFFGGFLEVLINF